MFFHRIKTFGHSMLPLLHGGDIVHLKRIKFQKLKVNDIITSRKFNKFFTHRVIYTTNKYLVTKGDNNLTSDGKIFPRQIIGKVTQVKRGSKTFNPEDLYLIQSSLYFAEIVKIKKALEKESVVFVFLKGLPLHLYFEKSHPQRIYVDCDILISKSQYNKAKQILVKHGYKKSDPHSPKKLTEVSYDKNLNGLAVVFDVHLEIDWMSPTRLGRLENFYPQKLLDELTVKFSQEKQEIKIQEEIFPVLSNENLVVYLMLHFFHHNFRGEFRLKFLANIIRILNPHEWQNIERTIIDYNLQNFVYPSFLFLNKYFPASLPQEVLVAIKPKADKLRFIHKIVRETNIFDFKKNTNRERFKNLFFLSPNKLMRRMLVFTNPGIIYSVYRVIKKKLFIRNNLFPFQISR